MAVGSSCAAPAARPHGRPETGKPSAEDGPAVAPAVDQSSVTSRWDTYYLHYRPSYSPYPGPVDRPTANRLILKIHFSFERHGPKEKHTKDQTIDYRFTEY